MRRLWHSLVWDIVMWLYVEYGEAVRAQREYPAGSFAYERSVIWGKLTMLKIKLWECFMAK